MPVPTSIAELSTTAGDNSPVSGDAPSVLDNHQRTSYSFIKELYNGARSGSYVWLGTGGGTADVITASLTPALTAYATGQTFRFISSGANTTNVTININSLGAKAITKNGSTALAAGDIPSGAVCTITYDGIRFQLVNATIIGIAQGGTGATTEVAARQALHVGIRGHISGILPTNNASDANNDIDFGVGEAVDSTGTYLMKLASTMTKRLDATWAAGTNQGGLFSGAKANSTWYHCHVIRKTSDGTIDAGFDTSVTAANIPTGYGAYRHVFSVRTNSSGNIEAFVAYEDGGGGLKVYWTSPTLDIDLANTLTTTARTDTIHVPTGYAVEAMLNIYATDGASGFLVYVSSPDVTDLAPTSTAAPLGSLGASATNTLSLQTFCMTNTSGQIRSRSSLATVDTYRVSTVGYKWGRR
jgi:hypothetical protein